jgi:hypothetical protein
MIDSVNINGKLLIPCGIRIEARVGTKDNETYEILEVLEQSTEDKVVSVWPSKFESEKDVDWFVRVLYGIDFKKVCIYLFIFSFLASFDFIYMHTYYLLHICLLFFSQVAGDMIIRSAGGDKPQTPTVNDSTTPDSDKSQSRGTNSVVIVVSIVVPVVIVIITAVILIACLMRRNRKAQNGGISCVCVKFIFILQFFSFFVLSFQQMSIQQLIAILKQCLNYVHSIYIFVLVC